MKSEPQADSETVKVQFNYVAKCTECGNTREMSVFKRKIRKFNPAKPAFTYVKCPKCGKRTRHEVME